MSLPAHYNDLPAGMHDTLIRSHVEFEKGWKGITLEGYLGVLETNKILPVITAIHKRCLGSCSAIWNHIDCIIGGWTYEAGHQISQGFNFKCGNPEALLSSLKGSSRFCQDSANCHGPRDTFRELITSGPGLHVCVTQKEKRVTDLHDIHIDKFQTVCTRQTDGFCEYTYLDTQMYNHMKDVAPWWIGERLKDLGKLIAEHPPERGPKF